MERLRQFGLDGGMTDHPELQSRTTLVIGGHGKTGRRVARRLAERGRSVRCVSRSTVPAFDWTRPTTWAPALEGVGAAYVTYQPDLAVPGASDAIAALGRLAQEHGLDRLVLLSGRGEPEAQRCEEILLGSGVDTSVVRASFFAQNFSEHFLVDAVLDGVIALPAGAVREPIVDADDIADVVVELLTRPGHEQRVHELTGPGLLSFTDVAEVLSTATGRVIRYEAVTPDEYAAAASAAGVSVGEAEMLAELFAHIFDGHNESLAHGVEEVLGRPARDFADFAADAAATGVWNVRAAQGATR
jgi:uncharacterized protein YbjT (DUF2867 family)